MTYKEYVESLKRLGGWVEGMERLSRHGFPEVFTEGLSGREVSSKYFVQSLVKLARDIVAYVT